MSELHPRTYFFKPSHPLGGVPVLNQIRVAENLSKGITTTLVLDTNVLIRMEKVVYGGNKKSLLKEHGLHNLVDFVNRCPPQSIALSPGMALGEMPPASAEKSRWLYEVFCSEHLPRFVDTPNCIKSKFEGKKTNYGFLDLEPIAQAFLAIPFCSLLYLNIVDKTYQGSPIRKFEEFLRRLSDDLDILSAKEIEIAKYCFSEPPAKSREAIEVKKVFRENFLKTKIGKGKLVRTFNEAMAVAFNGACDLSLINVLKCD